MLFSSKIQILNRSKSFYKKKKDKDSQALIGFRKWHVDENYNLLACTKNGYLTHKGGGYIWKRGINKASCDKCGHAPGGACHCGFNSFYNLKDALEGPYEGVLGVIAGAGEVRVHDVGFRSSEAQPIALLINTPYKKERESINKAAKKYLIPVFCSQKELNKFLYSIRGVDIRDQENCEEIISKLNAGKISFKTKLKIFASVFIPSLAFLAVSFFYKTQSGLAVVSFFEATSVILFFGFFYFLIVFFLTAYFLCDIEKLPESSSVYNKYFGRTAFAVCATVLISSLILIAKVVMFSEAII